MSFLNKENAILFNLNGQFTLTVVPDHDGQDFYVYVDDDMYWTVFDVLAAETARDVKNAIKRLLSAGRKLGASVDVPYGFTVGYGPGRDRLN